MYRTNKAHKHNNMFLYVFILFAIQIMTVLSATVLFVSHKNASSYDFDVTTIYRITNIKSSYYGFKYTDFLKLPKEYYSIEIHSRTNARGMPIQNNNEYFLGNHEGDLFNNGSNVISSRINFWYDAESWKKTKITESGIYCNYNSYSTTLSPYNYYKVVKHTRNEECTVVALEHVSQHNSYDNRTDFTLEWTPKKEHTCLAITYKHLLNSYFVFIIEIENENKELITSVNLEKNEGIMTLNINDTVFMKDHVYKLSLKNGYNTAYLSYSEDYYSIDSYHTEHVFGLIRIAQCSNYDDEEIRIIYPKENAVRPKAFHVIGNGMDHSEEKLSENLCLNGGIMYSEKTTCTCPTGFTGTHCETGCGMNSFGADCTGVCSDHERMCRGMYICTNYGCTCPAGLTGSSCSEDCNSGQYGADCLQTCSLNCNNNICDKYTGVCSQGCSPGYVPPYCLEKYPYLINPPRLIASHYHSIEMEINFHLDNVNSIDTSIKLKYYQLFYKSQGEESFRSSDIKLINLNDKKTTDVLYDLEADSEYIVGVLIITDDGNLNDQDIVYGHYKTSCAQPEIIDYNVKLIAGKNSVKVTWNKFTPNPLECEITENILTLISHQYHDQNLDAQEIISNSNSSHIFDGLLPGFQYNIKLNAKTAKGPLQSSPLYTITTLMTEKEIGIKDIVAKSTEDRIKISWILVNAYQQHAMHETSNIAVTCIVRYKINRIFSCSLKKIEQNWTSITVYNQTKYEIIDTVPNSQYHIQVVIHVNDATIAQPENNVYTLTPAIKPKTAPMFDTDHPLYVTNNSVLLHWKTDDDCSRLNGFFSNFYIVLRDVNVDKIVQIKETKQNYITFNDLISNNPYELKVFIKTHIGYDSEKFLLTNFNTKYENLKAVDDLVVYKKSIKNRVVGLRWSYSENTHLNGFIVSFNNDSLTNTENVSVLSPTKCTAWPQYYCHSFHDLIPRNYYTFKIKPKSLEYPEGGKESSIHFSSVDGLPDSPKNVQATDIGNTYISLKWEIPWIFNGLLKSFNINVEEISAKDMNTCCVTIAPIEILIDEEVPSYNYTLTDLKSGSTYSIGVLTVSKSSWYSSPSRFSTTTLLDI